MKIGKNNFEFWCKNIWQFWNFSSGHFIENRPLIIEECKVFFFSIQTAHYVRRFRHMADMIIAIVLLSLKKWSVVIYEKKPWFYRRREERLKNFFLFVLTFWGPFFSVSSTTTTSRVTSKKSIRTSFKAKMNYYSHNDSVFRGTHTIWWSYSAHSDLKSEKNLLNFPLFYSDEWGNSAQNDNLCVFWIILLWISIFAREKKRESWNFKKKKK